MAEGLANARDEAKPEHDGGGRPDLRERHVAVRPALHVDDGETVRLPEARHLLVDLLEDPPRLPVADGLQAHLHRVAVLLDVTAHGGYHPVRLVAWNERV